MEQINNIFAKAFNNMNEKVLDKENGDYEKDGLIYCGLCKTAKQQTKNIGGKDTIIPKTCDCKKKEIEDTEKKLKEYRKQIQLAGLRSSAFDDELLLNQTFNTDDGTLEHRQLGLNYVEKFEEMEKENIGLLFTGNVGTGKTFLASAIANALIEKNIKVKMTNFSKILNDMTNFEINKNKYIENLNKFRLLIIDDFGMERDTSFATEHIFNIIDSRYRANKPIILTTNLSIENLTNQTELREKRIYSRILEMATPIIFTGKNHRLIKTREKAKKVSNLLMEGGDKTCETTMCQEKLLR